MNKSPLSFNMLSNLDYAIELWRVEDCHVKPSGDSATPLDVLAVTFRGEYVRDGLDSAFMEGVIAWTLLAWDAHGLVLDFRELSYGWGDRMQNVLNAGFVQRGGAQHFIRRLFIPREPQVFPTAVIVSGKCKAGLESLIAEEMHGFAGTLRGCE